MNYYVDSGTVSHLWTVPLIFHDIGPLLPAWTSFASQISSSTGIFTIQKRSQFYQFLEEDKLSSTSQINEFNYLSFFEQQLQHNPLHLLSCAINDP